jgi:hypothetical protein
MDALALSHNWAVGQKMRKTFELQETDPLSCAKAQALQKHKTFRKYWQQE